MRIHVLQHVPFEGPAAIGEWAELRGHSIAKTPLYETTDVPPQSDFDWLVVMGGPMGVHDRADYPWLEPEKAFIRETIAAGRKAVGVCLGSQLIAEALGARVSRNPQKEIGWLPITLTQAGRDSSVTGCLPERLEVFHWHGDTFELPAGAVHLARSAVCESQIFLYDNRVLALQCHLESTQQSVRDIVEMCADEIVPSTSIQTAERILAQTHADVSRMHEQLFGMLDRFAALG
ncbi:type 1 glutamine amidotransferase [Thiorhodococcus minor]|uniref:Type 1 glutamine amidotransferase n=1 Tax=Thiorhodococcus minor TaxID=57489 RepID=A0A6M0JZV0_9GAMM|nr:type 1 glutamine amidotransferase [Thiorhodococcus minor]NEV61867.1 type 1 glutamine amidotransferase [Thiorhodococcus minor]